MSFARGKDLELSKTQVAVAITHGRFGSHTGVVFHTAKDGLQIVHLKFHKMLTPEPFPPLTHCWIACVVTIPEPASKQLVAFVRAVAKRLPQINFGINFLAAKGSFDNSGRYSPPRGSDGLTCATFVTELFRWASLPLITEETWQPRHENIDWGEAVCKELERVGADAHHTASVRRNINGLRVRPEEVAAAANMEYVARPVDYQTAFAGAPAVMASLHSHCPPIAGSLR